MPFAAVNGAPFSLAVPSEDAVPHQSWVRACQEALAAVRRGESVAVLGLAGTGKTFLLERLGQTLHNEGWRVLSHGVSQGPGSPADVLLVDEADRLPSEALDAVRDRDGLCIFAGLPGIAQRLAGGAEPIVTVTLEPLSPEDVARFVAARLSATGHRRDLLEPDAVLALARHSAGLVRLVVVLAGSAMFLAEYEGAERVSKRHVDEAAALRDIGDAAEAVEPDLARYAGHVPGSRVSAMVAPMGPKLNPARPLRTSWVAFGLGGVLALAAFGWMLLPGQGGSITPALPHREAAVSLPPDAVAVPEAAASPPVGQPAPAVAAVPAPGGVPAPVGSPGVGAAPSSGGGAHVVPPTPSRQVDPVMAFQGPVFNETISQKGLLSLGIRREGSGRVSAHFQASAGLLGSGELIGTMTADGRIVASGRLMVGRNPFDTTLVATMVGDRLEGTAVFVRPETGSTSRSRFNLARF